MAWIEEGLGRLREEVKCAVDHFERREYPQIVTHMQGLELGVRSIGAAVYEWLLDMRERAEVVKALQETQTGQPMRIEEFKDGYMIVPERIEVPDDASGLE